MPAAPPQDRPARPRAVLLTGTLAIDTVCAYPGRLHALPRHPGINLSIQLSGFERRFGGCAMNIAYTLKLLGDAPAPLVFVGQDFGDSDYAAHLRQSGIDASLIVPTDAPHGAHGFIFTDKAQNQFTGFYGGPGAQAGAELASRLRAALAGRRWDYAILAPDVPANMMAAAQALRDSGVPFLTDPGQNLTDFAAAEARALLALSNAVMVNEYEHATLRRLAGELVDELALLIITRGERGCCWRSASEGDGEEWAAPATVADPTGCGDAFRAGFVHARLRGAPLVEAVRSGSTTAAIVLETQGTQRHDCAGFGERYRAVWGDAPAWLS